MFWGSTSWTLPTSDYREASTGSLVFLFKYFYYYYFECGTFKLSQFFACFAFCFFFFQIWGLKTQWFIVIILKQESLRQEYHKFEVSWGYTKKVSLQIKANLTLMHFPLSLRFKQWKGKQLFCGTIYLELWLNAGPTNIYFMVLVCLTFALSKHNQWGPPEVDWPSVLCHIEEAWGFSSSSGVTGLKDLVKITVLLFCVDVFQGQSRFWRGRHTNAHARLLSLSIICVTVKASVTK